MKLTKAQIEHIQKRRQYVDSLRKDTGKPPPVFLSMEMHTYNALIELHNIAIKEECEQVPKA